MTILILLGVKMNRRNLLGSISSLGAGLILSGCSITNRPSAAAKLSSSKQIEEEMVGEVTATEDLMREHGVLRRALFIYSEIAARLRITPSGIVPDSLQKTAMLFRDFGEEYHEKQLEEAYIFPAIKQTGGEAAVYPDILITQHNRGREITDYILAVTRNSKLNVSDTEQLAHAMESMVRMYRPHAAREDTIVFPAWKQALTALQLDEMNDKFEEIEHQQFGEDGFENAVRQIAAIENELGMYDLSQFTALQLTPK
jgi:hemerythrin-like domain-containing protein